MTSNEDEPVRLVEDAETGDRFLVYGTDKGFRLDIRYEGDTLWMTQAQIARLFGVDRSVITKHIANVYADGELDAEATSARIAQVRQEGSRNVERRIEHYNLDAVISVGYRVSSTQATVFRRWATGILVQFAKKGLNCNAISKPTSESRPWPKRQRACPSRHGDRQGSNGRSAGSAESHLLACRHFLRAGPLRSADAAQMLMSASRAWTSMRANSASENSRLASAPTESSI